MKFSPDPFLRQLPLPPTERWPEGVRDIEAFRHGSLSLVLFAPRGKDYQTPHEQDELYVVIRGTAEFEAEGRVVPCEAGDTLFVPAGAPHRFLKCSEDFVTWAVFYGPAGGERSQPSTPQHQERV